MHECSAHQVVLTPSMKELKLNSEEVKHGNFVRFILFAVARKTDLFYNSKGLCGNFTKISVEFPFQNSSLLTCVLYKEYMYKVSRKVIHR